MSPKVLVVCGHGINCERETARAFLTVGFEVDVLPFRHVIGCASVLHSYQVLVIPGGFSYGDSTGAGNAMGALIRHFLLEQIDDFIRRGNLVLGICNGCQVLARSGFLSEEGREVALDHNASGHYECRWVYVRAPVSSIWFDKDEILAIPVAHGEGNFVVRGEAGEAVALRYCDEDGNYARGAYPVNPNGSAGDVAALVSRGGSVMGIMPHPERAFERHQHPDFLRSLRCDGVQCPTTRNFFVRIMKAF